MTTVTAKEVVRQIAMFTGQIQEVIDYIDELSENLPPEKPLVITHTDEKTLQRLGVKFNNVDDMVNYMNTILQRGQN